MEATLKFGKNDNLVGIMNRPGVAKTSVKDALVLPTFVFINAGFLHHVGPYRLYTDLARMLSANGFASLRFDLSGIGDSSASELGSDYTKQSQSDIIDAFNALEKNFGYKEFIVCGLCSGADDALKIALDDDRVKGAVFVDGGGFRTPWFYVNHFLKHYPRRLASRTKWKVIVRAIQRKLEMRSSASATMDDDYHETEISAEPKKSESMNDNLRQLPSKDKLIEEVTFLTNRKTNLFFLYTGGVSDYYNYSSQFKDMFKNIGTGGYANSYYLADSDHLMLLERHRRKAISAITDWAIESFDTRRRLGRKLAPEDLEQPNGQSKSISRAA